MATNLEHLRGARLPDATQGLTPRDCILYALGIGIGLDPVNESDLAFVDETRLRVVPSMANIMADNGHWLRHLDPGLDWRQAVHGEQSMEIHAPLPHTATVRAAGTILDVVDKGPGRGALLHVQREISDVDTGQRYATVLQTVFCRANGGFGGQPGKPRPAWEKPDRSADVSMDLPTSPQQALIYRLSGDDHPLHIDPATARAAGFPRPILHGMATFGLVGHGLAKVLCKGDPLRVKTMSGRFSAPVFPGDAVTVDIWNMSEGTAYFLARTSAPQAVVLTNGIFTYAH